MQCSLKLAPEEGTSIGGLHRVSRMQAVTPEVWPPPACV